MEHTEKHSPFGPHSFLCSCGAVSVGTPEDPAFFRDHLRQVEHESRAKRAAEQCG